MTTVITSGSTLTLGPGVIWQGGSVAPTNVEYTGTVMHDYAYQQNTTLSFNLNGIPDGDLMLICYFYPDNYYSTYYGTGHSLQDANKPGVTNAGWSSFYPHYDFNGWSSSDHTHQLYWKIKDSTDTTVTVQQGGYHQQAFLSTYRNASNVTRQSYGDTTQNTYLSYPAANYGDPVAAGHLVVRFGCTMGRTSLSSNTFAGHTLIQTSPGDTSYTAYLWHYDSQEGGTVNAGGHSYYSQWGGVWASSASIIIQN